LILIGNDPEKPYPLYKRKLIDFIFMILTRVMMLIPNCFWLHKTLVKYDYSPYLGPDFKPEYEGASTIIGNHASWLVNYLHF
jgi:hypothetical protein